MEEEVKILFKNSEGSIKDITITVQQLIDNTEDYLYECLEASNSCISPMCNDESRIFL